MKSISSQCSFSSFSPVSPRRKVFAVRYDWNIKIIECVCHGNKEYFIFGHFPRIISDLSDWTTDIWIPAEYHHLSHIHRNCLGIVQNVFAMNICVAFRIIHRLAIIHSIIHRRSTRRDSKDIQTHIFSNEVFLKVNT